MMNEETSKDLTAEQIEVIKIKTKEIEIENRKLDIIAKRNQILIRLLPLIDKSAYFIGLLSICAVCHIINLFI